MGREVDARIRLRDAAFGYGGKAVVAGVDLTLGRGTFLGVLGPNGAGKTTLLKGVLGLLAPLRGEVEHRTRSLGYVPQRDTLDAVFPVTVEEVVHMGIYGRVGGARPLGGAERELARSSLERVGLAASRRKLFSSLSGGQRQRALIARALAMRPDVLLLDEPTSGVDRQSQQVILELLSGLNRDEGLAVLLVTHELALARERLPEIVWVADGGIERGPAEEILRRKLLPGETGAR